MVAAVQAALLTTLANHHRHTQAALRTQAVQAAAVAALALRHILAAQAHVVAEAASLEAEEAEAIQAEVHMVEAAVVDHKPLKRIFIIPFFDHEENSFYNISFCVHGSSHGTEYC